MEAKSGCKGEKRNRRPAQEIGEDEQGHSFGDARVVRVPSLRPANSAVHLQVAAHENEKRNAVDKHEEDYVG